MRKRVNISMDEEMLAQIEYLCTTGEGEAETMSGLLRRLVNEARNPTSVHNAGTSVHNRAPVIDYSNDTMRQVRKLMVHHKYTSCDDLLRDLIAYHYEELPKD